MPDFADDVPLMPGSKLALASIVCVSCPYFSHPFDKSSQEIDSCRVSCVPLAPVWDNRRTTTYSVSTFTLASSCWLPINEKPLCETMDGSYTTPYPDSLSPELRIARLHPGYSQSAMSKTPSWLSAPLKLCHECTSIPLVRLSLVRDLPMHSRCILASASHYSKGAAVDSLSHAPQEVTNCFTPVLSRSTPSCGWQWEACQRPSIVFTLSRACDRPLLTNCISWFSSSQSPRLASPFEASRDKIRPSPLTLGVE